MTDKIVEGFLAAIDFPPYTLMTGVVGADQPNAGNIEWYWICGRQEFKTQQEASNHWHELREKAAINFLQAQGWRDCSQPPPKNPIVPGEGYVTENSGPVDK